VAGEAEGDRAPYRLREAQFEQAPECVGLHETTLAPEAVEVQRSQSAAAMLHQRQLADVHDLR
jgi:hypothetical protein